MSVAARRVAWSARPADLSGHPGSGAAASRKELAPNE